MVSVPGGIAVFGNEACRKEVDLRRAQPAGHIAVARILVNLARRADLKKFAVFDHADAGGHRHGLDLIVRYVEDRRAEFDLNSFQFKPHLGAQFGVERGQRLVHEIDGGIANQRTSNRHPLHFAAGEPGRSLASLPVMCRSSAVRSTRSRIVSLGNSPGTGDRSGNARLS